MNEHLLQIDVSNSKYNTKKDLIKIRFQNEDDIQINFINFFVQSSYIRDKYKYSEALELIQSEIEEAEKKFKINEKSIKDFINLIQDEKVSIPIERYKDIYTLSEYFNVPKFTFELDNISQEELLKDLDFTIQTLIDSETTNDDLETKLSSKIENFLRVRINECFTNAKFRELSISTICRIVDQSKEKVDHNLLVDFILESVDTRFILLQFLKLQKLTNEKVKEFIKFISEQDEDSKTIYFNYMKFNFEFIKNIIDKYDHILNELNETKQEMNEGKQELNDTKQELNATKDELNATKEELNATKEELNVAKQESNQCKSELKKCIDEFNRKQNEKKQYKQAIIVGGDNRFNVLGENPNNKAGDNTLIIHPPVVSSFDHSLLQSYSIYCIHSVLVMSDGSLKGIGDNSDGRISSTLQKTVLRNFTDFCIKDDSGIQLTAVSAVCCIRGTLYMFSKSSKERQLVLCDCEINGGDPVFLDIGNHHPVSLFGGRYHSAAIGSEGEVIFINRDSVKNLPNSPIAAVSLPDGEKASSVACCDDSVVVLSSNGRVFTSNVQSNEVLKFSPVLELSGQEIVCVSGTSEHFLAVSKEGRVFGRGSNGHGRLGLGEGTKSVSSFTEISSLEGYEIRAAYAGWRHSLFETREGKILACGHNYYGQLLLSSGPCGNVYSPTETTISSGASFCIAGSTLSVIFIGSDPPPNTPNMRICQF